MDGRGGSTAPCRVPEWAMERLCDGTSYASLSYSQGRVCPPPFCSYPPLHASGSAITSWWLKGKKNTHAKKVPKIFKWHPTAAAIEWTFPRDNLTRPLMWLLPPLNTLLVWHISHSAASTGAAGAGKSADAGDQPAFTRVTPHWWSWCWEISQHSPE